MIFPMRLGIWRPLFLLGGATRATSYVEVDAATVRFRFGGGPLGFDERIERRRVRDARARSWPFFLGIGWRIGTGGIVGLIGATSGIVEVDLAPPLRTRVAFIPLTCRQILVSVEDPTGLVAALRAPA